MEDDALEPTQHEPLRKASTIPKLPALPSWKQKLLDKTAGANSKADRIVKDSHAREELARQKLTKMRVQAQRALQRAQSEASLLAKIERNREMAVSVKTESRELAGLDVTSRLADIPAPTDEEVKELSVLFNGQLARHYGDDHTFYRIFKDMDLDGSQRISYAELETLTRGALHLDAKSFPRARLDMLWKALDLNESGYIDAGELSRFTRLGKKKTLTAAQVARKLVQAQNERTHALERAASDKRLAKDVVAKQLQVEAASKEELERLSLLFTKALAKISPGTAQVHTLFKKMDKDGSGRVTIAELRAAVREELRLSPAQLTDDKLWSLWKSLDENENGFICAGEWGRFMRAHAASALAGSNIGAECSEKLREAHELEMARKNEDWAQQAASKANDLARQMEDEARRLEALLARASNRLLKPTRSVPALLDRSASVSSGLIQESSTKAGGEMGGAADGEGAEGGGGAGASPSSTLSPLRSASELKKLSAEIAGGGGVRRGSSRNRVAPNGSADPPILRSFAREEGQI